MTVSPARLITYHLSHNTKFTDRQLNNFRDCNNNATFPLYLDMLLFHNLDYGGTNHLLL